MNPAFEVPDLAVAIEQRRGAHAIDALRHPAAQRIIRVHRAHARLRGAQHPVLKIKPECGDPVARQVLQAVIGQRPRPDPQLSWSRRQIGQKLKKLNICCALKALCRIHDLIFVPL